MFLRECFLLSWPDQHLFFTNPPCNSMLLVKCGPLQAAAAPARGCAGWRPLARLHFLCLILFLICRLNLRAARTLSQHFKSLLLKGSEAFLGGKHHSNLKSSQRSDSTCRNRIQWNRGIFDIDILIVCSFSCLHQTLDSAGDWQRLVLPPPSLRGNGSVGKAFPLVSPSRGKRPKLLWLQRLLRRQRLWPHMQQALQTRQRLSIWSGTVPKTLTWDAPAVSGLA